LLIAPGCSPAPAEPAPGVSDGTPTLGKNVSFSFDSLDERPVSSEAARGRIAVIAFIATWDLSSQAEVNYLVAMSKHDEASVYYALVALDDPKNRELVEAYKKTLAVTFPVAMADQETVAGRGSIPGVNQLPTIVVLDRTGRVTFQRSGLVKPEEIRPHMR
jgi:hypothetical protein